MPAILGHVTLVDFHVVLMAFAAGAATGAAAVLAGWALRRTRNAER